MIILDTSVWIEFFKNNPVINPPVKSFLENQKILALECIFAELLQGAKNKREIDIISLYWDNLPHYSKQHHWIEAGIYSSRNKLHSKGIGLIDCVIIISARNANARIWSLDKKLNSVLKKEELFQV
jgi:predicted nucleic acid-binding protein